MTDLRQRLLAGDVLVGTFLKTPDPRLVEILGLAGLDFLVADQEQAPLGIEALDLIALAGKAAQMPVRVPSRQPEAFGAVVDVGRAGVVAPHVRGPDAAGAIVDAGARAIATAPRGA